MPHIPTQNKLTIYRYLFQEGVLVAPKDFKLAKHPQIESVSNLDVLSTLRSFKSKKFVTESFNWQYYYWVLTDEGIKYLSQYLQLPESVVPATLKKQNSSRPSSYSRQEEKRTGASGDFEPSYRGGDRRRGGLGRGGYRREGQTNTTN
ncbi:hypothetical protein DICPUDRAFT_92515 [Dictyostelium purpureum]|uniref:Plectin/eS10 N-terminal domain-containing protein n=1 Tax=Dictyostelium purpureum TaxID=5786 RepID=F0ZT34_DICPU|nr:uncharacterized protein DICPUDRAFT_92515 [Dictyostelium purpureum]EGC32898.1 hypothetical protein DICPUDRAFT_92515 [Dictyostelium purpureum]|eukprot:XP_003290583.1 hypothetical protein DICPUDRAFT_92515 [Dictyostelium purpureum]